MTRLLKTSEVADRLGICRDTARVWCKSGQLPAIQVGAHYRVEESDLEQWIEDSKVAQKPQVKTNRWF